jgi:sec-independent protein translocase protein TatA
MTALAFLDIGFAELVVVGFVGLVLYGGKLPEVARSLGASYRKLRRSVEDLARDVNPTRPTAPPSVPYRPSPPSSPEALPRPAPPPAPARDAHEEPRGRSEPRDDDAPLV